MNTSRILLPIAITCLLAGPARADLDTTIGNALTFSAEQVEDLAGILRTNSRFVDYSNTSGTWQIKNKSSWCSGFSPGMFWYMWDLTGETKYRGWAQNWTEGVRARATEADNDTGFQIYCSFGLGYTLTGETNTDYFDVMETAAETFATQRFNPTIGSYRAWTNSSSNPVSDPDLTASTTNPNDMVFEVNIDMMMNMELPLFVGTNGGNADYVAYAVSHADRSWGDLVRVDGSTFHVVGYKADGTVDYKRTHQGWQTDSTWSRGQAWAVYGYAMVHRYTGLQRMLDRSELCFDYFMAATAAQTDDFIPFSDFDAPLNPSNPRDTSAAAIVASAALDLYEMTGTQKYLDAAESILLELGSPDFLAQGTAYQPILLKGSSKWGDPEEGTSFGDFYFIEAMRRHRALFPSVLPPDPEPSDALLINISTRGLVGDEAEILIAGFVVGGTEPMTVLLRGVGPGLGQFGLEDAVADPVIQLYDPEVSDDVPVALNDDWQDDGNGAAIEVAALKVGAFALEPGSKDAALLLVLDPGLYTLQVLGKEAGVSKTGLVEVYQVPE